MFGKVKSDAARSYLGMPSGISMGQNDTRNTMKPAGQPSSLFSHGEAKDDFVVLDRTDFDYKDPDEKP